MAIDEPLQRGPPGSYSRMGQKMTLLHQSLSLPDSTSRHAGDDDDFNLPDEELAIVVAQQPMPVHDYDDPDGVVDYVPLRRGMPAGNSLSAKTKRGQKITVVHPRVSLLNSGSSRHVDDDDDNFKLAGEELAIVVGQPMAVDCCDALDGETDYSPLRVIDYPPLRIVRPENVENGQEKCSGFPYKQGEKKTSTCFTKTYKRRRGRPAGPKLSKRNMEQKPALFHGSSSSHRGRKSDKDDELEPSNKRKRRRPAGAKSAKSKKPRLAHSSSSSSDGKEDEDPDFEPEVSDDNGRKKYARVKDFYGTAWDKAKKVNEKLPAEGPSFVKLMLKSHVVRGFWLGLPVNFCRNYLPEHDVTIELEDEDGHNYDTNYLSKKKGLSGGWNGFAQQHDLKVNDVAVFQLVRPTRFKVYILRENQFSTTDGALGFLNLDTSKENNVSKEDSCNDDVKSKEDLEATGPSSKPRNDYDNNLASEEATNYEGIRCSKVDTSFAAVKSFRNFQIIVDGSVISRRLVPEHHRRTYYKLCCERKAFLHRHLPKRINPALVAGVIVETANIAVGVRAFRASSSSLEDLAVWKKTLESFELMDMDVTFMRKRLEDLLDHLTASRDLEIAVEELEGYKKVKLERDSAAEKTRGLKLRMSSLRDAVKEMDMEIKEKVESSARKKREQAMRKLASAPW